MAEQPWLVAEECEYEGHARNCTGGEGWANRTKQQLDDMEAQRRQHQRAASLEPTPPSPLTLGAARDDLEPVFEEYGVDIYWAGHIRT